jgi:hypothetical protein
LEAIDEEWDGPCPECQGLVNALPSHSGPYNRPLQPRTSTAKPAADEDKEALAVAQYVGSLANRLLTYLHAPNGPFYDTDPLRYEPEIGGWIEDGLKERHMGILAELNCRVNPEHGCHLRLETDEEHDEGIFLSDDGTNDCDCWSTYRPFLVNPALEIRRRVSMAVYIQFVRPLTLGELEEARDFDRVWHEAQKLYKDSILGTDNPRSKIGHHPVLETLTIYPTKLVERGKALEDLSWELHRTYLRCYQWRSLSDEDRQRFRARLKMMKWVRLILANDTGLTLQRARKILIMFTFLFVKHDPRWQTRQANPYIGPNWLPVELIQRLGASVNRHYNDIARWVERTILLEMREAHSVGYRDTWRWRWHWADRKRTRAVLDNVIPATEEELEALRNGVGETFCAGCGLDFDDHDTVFKIVVRNKHCPPGSRHWAIESCLVKLGRVLFPPKMVAPPPRCPICRTEFAPGFTFDRPDEGDEEEEVEFGRESDSSDSSEGSEESSTENSSEDSSEDSEIFYPNEVSYLVERAERAEKKNRLKPGPGWCHHFDDEREDEDKELDYELRMVDDESRGFFNWDSQNVPRHWVAVWNQRNASTDDGNASGQQG